MGGQKGNVGEGYIPSDSKDDSEKGVSCVVVRTRWLLVLLVIVVVVEAAMVSKRERVYVYVW